MLEAVNEEDRARWVIDDCQDDPTLEQASALETATETRAELSKGLHSDVHAFRKRHRRAVDAAEAARALLPPWRAACEHDVSRLDFMPLRTPAGEKRVTWVTAEHVVQFADGTSYPLSQVEVRGDRVIRLDEINWKTLLEAASRSKWMPPEYVVNDWHADLCRWLEHGPVDDVQHVVDKLAQQWDGCMYDAPGGEIDIGAAIRQACDRMLKQRSGDASVAQSPAPAGESTQTLRQRA